MKNAPMNAENSVQMTHISELFMRKQQLSVTVHGVLDDNCYVTTRQQSKRFVANRLFELRLSILFLLTLFFTLLFNFLPNRLGYLLLNS